MGNHESSIPVISSKSLIVIRMEVIQGQVHFNTADYFQLITATPPQCDHCGTFWQPFIISTGKKKMNPLPLSVHVTKFQNCRANLTTTHVITDNELPSSVKVHQCPSFLQLGFSVIRSLQDIASVFFNVCTCSATTHTRYFILHRHAGLFQHFHWHVN